MGSSDPGFDTRTLPPPPASADADHFYVVVVREGSSSMFDLPDTGVVTIGRAPDCDLPVDDASISRRHARLLIADGDVRVMDLESRNGTRVNGQEIEGAHPVMTGDVITAGAVTLILCHGRGTNAVRALLPADRLRPHLRSETARAMHFERPVAVVALSISGPSSRDALGAAVLERLRRMDEASWFDSGHLAVVLSEVAQDEAVETAQALVMACAEHATAVRAGVAVCPMDGCDAESLLAAARAAAGAARPGQVLTAGSTAVRLEIAAQTVVVVDPAMHRIYDLIRRLAQSDLPVLITGATGTGKELAAHAVHAWSPRAGKPFQVLNCAALQDNLVESELFGYERGAFTGATSAKSGLLEAARGGTVFLDEIGELSASGQAKLLRALESGKITRVGDVRERPIDIRLVAATNRNLAEEVSQGRFRQDLLFRLGGATVVVPPLRARAREIPLLAQAFLDEACARAGRPPMTLSVGAIQALVTRPWPGNVRELKNLMRLLAATSSDAVVEPWHLLDRANDGAEAPRPVVDAAVRALENAFKPLAEEIRELERRRMIEALEASGGEKKRAASLLKMPLRTFTEKARQFGLTRGDASS